MKRKWGVLAIILPIPSDTVTLIHPLAKGDKLDAAILTRLATLAPVTFPVSMFRAGALGLSFL